MGPKANAQPGRQARMLSPSISAALAPAKRRTIAFGGDQPCHEAESGNSRRKKSSRRPPSCPAGVGIRRPVRSRSSWDGPSRAPPTRGICTTRASGPRAVAGQFDAARRCDEGSGGAAVSPRLGELSLSTGTGRGGVEETSCWRIALADGLRDQRLPSIEGTRSCVVTRIAGSPIPSLPSRHLHGYAIAGVTSTRSILTSVPRRTELGISAIASTCSTSALSCSSAASPESSTS